MLTTLTRDCAPTGHLHDPGTIDDETLTPLDALQLATDECDATPAQFADWLAKVTDVPPARAGYLPQNVTALCGKQARGEDLTPWELVALWNAASPVVALRARHQLRELYRDAHEADIRRRARELVEASGGLWDEGL